MTKNACSERNQNNSWSITKKGKFSCRFVQAVPCSVLLHVGLKILTFFIVDLCPLGPKNVISYKDYVWPQDQLGFKRVNACPIRKYMKI